MLVVVNPTRIMLGPRRLPQAPDERDICGSQKVPLYADRGVLERWTSTTVEPALRSATSRGAEDRIGWGLRGTLGSALAGAGVVRALQPASVRAPPAATYLRPSAAYRKLTPDERRLGSRAGSDRVKELWQVRIRQAVLSQAGEGQTGQRRRRRICWYVIRGLRRYGQRGPVMSRNG